MERPFDAVILITVRLKEKERKEDEIWKVLREFGKDAKLSPRELESLFTAASILGDIPRENIERASSAIIKSYLNTKEGKKVNKFITKNFKMVNRNDKY